MLREAAVEFLGSADGWCVPSYGRRMGAHVDAIMERMDSGDLNEAVILVPARWDTAWWRRLSPSTVCFIRGRVRFGGHPTGAPFPSAVLYHGHRQDEFGRAFVRFGDVFAVTS